MMDVLCGRDKKSHHHCGNRRFRHIIEMNRLAYQQASTREQKTKLSMDIVGMIRTCGGRFLRESEEKEGEWEDVGDLIAREKVSHALRSAKDPHRPRVPKKRRPMAKYVPTPDEDELYEVTLKAQKEISEYFLRQEEDGKTMADMGLEEYCV